MEEKVLVLPFGKKIQIGNYTVLKYVKTLTKNQLKNLRDEKNIPQEVRKQLTRTGLPYIKVEAISQLWSVEFCCNTAVFIYIDRVLSQAIVADQAGRKLDRDSVADFAHLFGMWMTDTCVMGDSIYLQDKANALQALLDRQKSARQETEEEKAADDQILGEMQKEEEAKAAIIDMAENVRKEEENGEG